MRPEDFLTPDTLRDLELRKAERRNALASPDVCVVASFGPGFSEDLSSWQLTLSHSGELVQHIRICRFPGYKRQHKRVQRTVGKEFVRQVLERADELDFWHLQVEGNDVVTDTASLRILIRSGAKMRDYGPESVAHFALEGDDGARRFVELWDLIHQHAPFPERQ